MELVELDAAVEAGTEGFDDLGFEERAGAMQIDVAGNDGGKGEDEKDGRGPENGEHDGMMAMPTTDRGRCRFVHMNTQSFHLL